MSVTVARLFWHTIEATYTVRFDMHCIFISILKQVYSTKRHNCNALMSHLEIEVQEMFINSERNQMLLRGGIRITG